MKFKVRSLNMVNTYVLSLSPFAKISPFHCCEKHFLSCLNGEQEPSTKHFMFFYFFESVALIALAFPELLTKVICKSILPLK